MITLAAYCLAHDLDMHDAGETELVGYNNHMRAKCKECGDGFIE